jgi:hypothetical protein
METGQKSIKITLVHYLILADFCKKCVSDQQRYGMLASETPWWPISPTEAFFPAS